MRHMQHLAQSCSRGVKPVTVVNKMARKYRLAMHLQLTKPWKATVRRCHCEMTLRTKDGSLFPSSILSRCFSVCL